jgi:hypothetical protein
VIPSERGHEYTLDGVAWTLSRSVCAHTALVIVLPFASKEGKCIYSNLLDCDSEGTPLWSRNAISYTASKTLLGIVEQLEIKGHTSYVIPLKLVAFSKGCIVLSQFLKERSISLLSRVSSIVYIDPGSQVTNSLFPFESSEYKSFPSEVRIFLFATPYQFNDPKREWLRREIISFINQTSSNFQFLSELPGTLEGHFAAIPIAVARIS